MTEKKLTPEERQRILDLILAQLPQDPGEDENVCIACQ